MIEVYFLLVMIPMRMTRLARERGKSALAWSLAASGAWFGTELALVVLAVSNLDRLADVTEAGFAVFLVYVGPLLAGMFAFGRVQKRLEAYPVLPDDDLQGPAA
jgi:hypothetical protein